MKAETKFNILNNLFFSILFGAGFTILGGPLTGGPIDWDHFLIEAAFGIGVGFIISMIIPSGKLAFAVAAKAGKPGSFLFNLVMYTVILVIFLLFLCPVLTVFIGSVLFGAPVMAVLPTSYTLFIPFFLVGIVVLMLVGGLISKLAMSLAGMPAPERNPAPAQEVKG